MQTFERIAPITAQQAGFVSTAQAARVGVAPRALTRLAAAGVLDRPLRGVFRVLAAPTPPRSEILAAWTLLQGDRLPWEQALAGQPPVVISHTSAAQIHGLGTFPVNRPTFVVTRRRHDPPSGVYRSFTLPLEAPDWAWEYLPEGIRVAVTTPERTLIDLAWAEADPDHVREALVRALAAGAVDRGALRAALDRRWQRRGRGTPAWLKTELKAGG